MTHRTPYAILATAAAGQETNARNRRRNRGHRGPDSAGARAGRAAAFHEARGRGPGGGGCEPRFRLGCRSMSGGAAARARSEQTPARRAAPSPAPGPWPPAPVKCDTAGLRRHVIQHPAFGPLDGYEWVLAAAGHTARHTQQILEVKADPTFPR